MRSFRAPNTPPVCLAEDAESSSLRPVSRRKRPSRFGAAYAPVADPLGLLGEFPVRSMHHEQPDTLITHLHIHDVLEIGLCHRGDGVFLVDDKVLPFSAGCASIVTEREFHLARSSTGKTSSWSFHHVDVVALLRGAEDLDLIEVTRLGGPGFPNILSPSQHPEIVAIVKELDDEVWREAPAHKSAIRGLIQVLVARLIRLAPARDFEHANLTPNDRQAAIRKVGPALAVIASHFAEPLSISELAEACDLSETHFRRLFGLALQQSPAEYLARFRVHKASALLADGNAGVLDAALACGFNSLSAFSRQFSATFGQSPRAFRAKQRVA
jgi:AraC-like DNA-binding protein